MADAWKIDSSFDEFLLVDLLERGSGSDLGATCFGAGPLDVSRFGGCWRSHGASGRNGVLTESS